MPCTLFSKSRFSIFRNRSLLIVLVWSFSVLNVFHSLKSYPTVDVKFGPVSISMTIFLFSFLFSPLFGVIADVWWTRYLTVRNLLRLLWLSCIVYVLVSSLPTSKRVNVEYVKKAAVILTVFVMTLCLSGLLANLVQFGADQVFDGSSSDIGGLASWFVWLFHFSNVIVTFILDSVSSTYKPLVMVAITSSWLTFSLCLDSLCSNCLIKEPTSANPLILIYKVVKFCIKNKYPRLRSAFTYWDDKPYSRIDLGKAKYGGPFTDEQVQDVKTFFHIVIFLVTAALSSGFYIVFYGFVPEKINSLYKESICRHQDKGIAHKCMPTVIYENPGFIFSLIWVPLYELGLHHFFRRWTILIKLAVGYLAIFFVVFGYLGIESFNYATSKNSTGTCILLQNSFNNEHRISYFWYMIPNSLLGAGQFLIISAAVEFMCAQVPYSMKGLFFGLLLLFLDLGVCLTFLLFLPVIITLKDWGSKENESCMLWILLAGNVLVLLLFVFAGCVFSRYKRRRRDDREFNEHMFAFNYYDRYLSQEK